MSDLRDALRYDGWATLALIDHCRRLSRPELQLTAPGTYGAIDQTIGHLVGAQEFYVYALTGERADPNLVPRDKVDLAEVRQHAARSRELLDGLADTGFDPDSDAFAVWHGNRRRGVIVAQLLAHGAEHRGQINTILGANGLEPANIGVRAFADTAGLKDG